MIAYAGGFGLGTALGGALDAWIASGQVFIRLMAPVDSPQVAPQLRAAGFGATVLNAEGREGEVRLTLSAIPRRRLSEALRIVAAANPEAYATVEDVAASPVTSMKAVRIRK